MIGAACLKKTNSFNGGNMPDMGSFTPPGQQEETQEKSAGTENGGENTADDAASTNSGRSRPSNFPGMGGTNQTTLKNLLTFGICMAVMLAALFTVIFLKRRNRR